MIFNVFKIKNLCYYRRDRGIWIKAVKKEIYNIAQNKSVRAFKFIKISLVVSCNYQSFVI